MDEKIPDYVIRKRARDRAYWAANRDRLVKVSAKAQHARAVADRAKMYAYSRSTFARNLGQHCECCEPEQFADIYRKAREAGLQVDHIVAFGLGGIHCCTNLQLMTVDEHKIKTRVDMQEIMRRKSQV